MINNASWICECMLNNIVVLFYFSFQMSSFNSLKYVLCIKLNVDISNWGYFLCGNCYFLFN
jgi:hypothetical protein